MIKKTVFALIFSIIILMATNASSLFPNKSSFSETEVNSDFSLNLLQPKVCHEYPYCTAD